MAFANGLMLKKEIRMTDGDGKKKLCWRASAKESKTIHRGGEGIRFLFFVSR